MGACAFLLIGLIWAAVTVVAVWQMARLPASVPDYERIRNLLIGLSAGATFASIGLAAWGARQILRQAPESVTGVAESDVLLWSVGAEPTGAEPHRAEQLRAQYRRTADVLRRMRALQDKVLRCSRRAKTG
ncbi:MAG: hypothetical protein RL684_2246 [Pseudomonadota bacterium]